MQAAFKIRKNVQGFKEWVITAVIRVLEYKIEISYGLMAMNSENEFNRGHLEYLQVDIFFGIFFDVDDKRIQVGYGAVQVIIKFFIFKQFPISIII